MKKYTWMLLALLMAGSFVSKKSFAGSGVNTNLVTSINASDTLILDLTQVTVNGNHFEFPVSISTDDTIFSLDFSFKINQADMVFDSIVNLTNYLDIFSFYQPADSTVRFTSNSLQDYQHNTSLVAVGLTIISGQINSSNFTSLHAYLNGAQCTVRVIDALIMDAHEYRSLLKDATVFPNPASDKSIVQFNLSQTEPVALTLFNLGGNKVKEIKLTHVDKGANSFSLDVSDLNEGIYILKVMQNKSEQNIRVAVVK